MKNSIKPLVIWIILLGSCAENREPSSINDERVALLTGYSLQNLEDDFVFQGKLFHRNDLSAERSYVFFKAFKVEARETTTLYVSQLAVLSECELPEVLQASLRIPETYDVIALNSKVERNKLLFMDPVERGTYILTLGLLHSEECDSGFEIGLSLSDSPRQNIKPVQPRPAPTLTAEVGSEPSDVEHPDPVLPPTPANPPVEQPADSMPDTPTVPLVGEWQQEYVSNNRNIKQVRIYTEKTLEKIVYDQNLQTEHVVFSVKFSPDKSQYEATVSEIKIYKYSPAKYKIGDKYFCSYEISENEGLENLRYSCTSEIYPDNIPQNYAPYKRK